MQSLSIDLDKLASDFDNLLKDIPDMRREFHTELSEVLKTEVDSSISSNINDSQGKVQGWQEENVGSGGGYAAIRAVKGGDIRPTKKPHSCSPGAITNYLENGHKIRSRGTVTGGGENMRYRPRINTVYVEGRHFYAETSNRIEAQLISHAEAYVQKLGNRLEGKG